MEQTQIIVDVRDKNNTYTAKFGRNTASCTAGAEQAVNRLAERIFGPLQRVRLVFLERVGRSEEKWAIRVDLTQRCQVCGCNFEKACDGGCHWVTEELCSCCLNPKVGMTVVLEDQGQDFLEFDIQGGKVIETYPFQGFVWNGAEVLMDWIMPGMQISLRTQNSDTARTIRYPVKEVKLLVHRDG